MNRFLYLIDNFYSILRIKYCSIVIIKLLKAILIWLRDSASSKYKPIELKKLIFGTYVFPSGTHPFKYSCKIETKSVTILKKFSIKKPLFFYIQLMTCSLFISCVEFSRVSSNKNSFFLLSSKISVCK